MNPNRNRERNLQALRRASAHLPESDRAALAAVIDDVADLYEQDRQLRAMLARWEQQYGPKDNCVRALKAVLGGGL